MLLAPAVIEKIRMPGIKMPISRGKATSEYVMYLFFLNTDRSFEATIHAFANLTVPSPP
jgi:hypothetical protein